MESSFSRQSAASLSVPEACREACCTPLCHTGGCSGCRLGLETPVVNRRKQATHPFQPGRGIVKGGTQLRGFSTGAVTDVRLKRKEQEHKSALLCHQPRWGLRWVWALPLEGIWDHSQLCVFPQLGGGACSPVPGRPTPQPPPRRPQTCVSFSLGFMVLARSWEPHESKPHK